MIQRLKGRGKLNQTYVFRSEMLRKKQKQKQRGKQVKRDILFRGTNSMFSSLFAYVVGSVFAQYGERISHNQAAETKRRGIPSYFPLSVYQGS